MSRSNDPINGGTLFARFLLYGAVTGAILLCGGGPTAYGIFSFGVADGYLVNKRVNYVQSENGTITVREKEGYSFLATLFGTPPGLITDAGSSLSVPGAGPVAFTRVGEDEDILTISESVDEAVEFESSYPPGSYIFNVAIASGGSTSASLMLPAAGNPYPAPPDIANFTDPQEDDPIDIDPDSPFNLRWAPFTTSSGPATGSDYILVAVGNPDTPESDSVFLSGGPTSDDGLDGTATEILIPAGTFLHGKSYTARVVFVDVLDTEFSIFLGIGIPAYATQTEFQLRTQETELTFIRWKAHQSSDPGGLHEDPDGDGLMNQMEYALGLDPFEKNSESEAVLPLSISESSGKMTFSSRRVANATDINYIWETTSDFITWDATDPIIEVTGLTDDPFPVELLEVCFPLSGDPILFARLKLHSTLTR
jgi:hypothetical protein